MKQTSTIPGAKTQADSNPGLRFFFLGKQSDFIFSIFMNKEAQ